MHALLFEMKPKAGHEDHYFAHAQSLRPLLADHAGLLYLERFKSMSRPNVILSHSHWRDEASLAKWRSDPNHHKSQSAGRYKHFADYRIRISHVLKMARRGAAELKWSVEGAYASVDANPPRYLTIIASENEPATQNGECFHSVTTEGRFLCFGEAGSREDGVEAVDGASANPRVTNAMLTLVSRDYGMFERTEAPQYFPDATER